MDSEKALRDLRQSFDSIELQLLRADRVAGVEHLVFAARNAIDSFTGKGRRAKHLSMELLLFATGEHQIVEAINLLGVTKSSTELVLIALSETNKNSSTLIDRATEVVRGIPDDSVLNVDTTRKRKVLKRAYNIPNKELTASKMAGESDSSLLKRLVIERSALLVLEN